MKCVCEGGEEAGQSIVQLRYFILRLCQINVVKEAGGGGAERRKEGGVREGRRGTRRGKGREVVGVEECTAPCQCLVACTAQPHYAY